MYERYLVTAVLVGVLVVLASERLRYDLAALLGLLALGATGVLAPRELAGGFGNPALLTVAAMSVLSRAFQKTAFLRRVAYGLGRLGRHPVMLAGLGTLVVAVLSAFMNNVAAVSLAIPLMVGIARRHHLPLSRLLLPLAYGSLVGGTVTLIGSPPNLLASGFLQERGLPPLGFFELSLLGAVLVALTVVYFTTIGFHLLPAGREPRDLALEYNVTSYIAEAAVTDQCRAVGMTIAETPMSRLYDATILTILRGGTRIYAPAPHQRLFSGDILQLEVSRDNLVAMARDLGLQVLPRGARAELELEPERVQVCDAVIAAGSPLAGHTLRELDFRHQYGLSVLAIHRRGQSLHHRLADFRLEGGDVLLLLGPPPALGEACGRLGLVLLNHSPVARSRADLPVLLAFVGLITVVAAGWMPLVVAGLLAAAAMVLTGVLSFEELYAAVPWPVLVLLGSMFGLAAAAERVGTSTVLAGLMLSVAGGAPLGALALVFAVTSGLTAVLTNAAAFMLVAPVALAVAGTLGADPRPFLIMTVVGAAAAFFSPAGHHSNALVYSAGGYRFSDYARVGLGLCVLLGVASLLLVPRLWPLFP